MSVCEKIIARDVNNYINIIDEKNIKFKGCFEIDRDFHKNHSKRIVAIALANYYINGKSCDETIIEYLNDTTDFNFAKNYGIYDFCLGSKMKGQNKLFKRDIRDFSVCDTSLSKMNRYYVSNEGSELIKKLPPLDKNKLTDTEKVKLINPDQVNLFDFIEDTVTIEPKDRETNIESGWKCTIFNKYIEKKHNNEYDVNYDYYINECNKIINAVENDRRK